MVESSLLIKSDSISLYAPDCLSVKASLIDLISSAVVPFTYRLVFACARPSTLTNTKKRTVMKRKI